MAYGSISLEKRIKENIKNYVSKIITSIQNAWNKFKGNVINTKMKYSVGEIEKAIAAAGEKTNIVIENYLTYNFSTIETLKVTPLDYGTMKESLTDLETFMKFQIQIMNLLKRRY